MSERPRHYLTDRRGNVLTAGRWLGARHTPEQHDYIYVDCRACGVWQVVPMICALHTRHEQGAKFQRDSNGCLHIDTRDEYVPTSVLARCLSCERTLAVRMVGRFFAPWSFGYGIVKPMSSAWIKAPEEADEP